MYKLWLEIKGIKIIALIVSLVVFIISLLIEKKIDIVLLLLVLLCLARILKAIFKYLSLKKNGSLIEMPYYFKMLNNNEKVLIIDYTTVDGTSIQLFKKRLNWGNINESGNINVVINTNNPKQYYIFDPKQ